MIPTISKSLASTAKKVLLATSLALLTIGGFNMLQAQAQTSYGGWCPGYSNYGALGSLGEPGDLSVKLTQGGLAVTDPASFTVTSFPAQIDVTFTVNNPLLSGTCWESYGGTGSFGGINSYALREYYNFAGRIRQEYTQNDYGTTNIYYNELGNCDLRGGLCYRTVTINTPGTYSFDIGAIRGGTSYTSLTTSVHNITITKRDMGPPTFPSGFKINNGADITTTRTVTIPAINSISQDDIGVTACSISNTGNSSDWQTVNCATATQWNLTPNDGLKTVYVRACDAVNQCTVANDTIMLQTRDTEPPTWTPGFNFQINDGASTTNTPVVTLTKLSAQDNVGIAYCRASNDGINWVNIACDQPITWMLQPGLSGDRTVSVQACDAWGLCANANDSITYNNPSFTFPDSIQKSLNLASLPALTYPTWDSNFRFQLNNGNADTSSRNITLGKILPTSPTNLTCGASNDGTNWTTVNCSQDNIPWQLESGAGSTRMVYVRACNPQNRCAYTADGIQYNSSNGIPTSIAHLLVVPLTTVANALPGFTSTPGISLKSYINDKEPQTCRIDQGSGLGSTLTQNGATGCGNVGYKSFTLNNIASPSTPANPFKVFTLQTTDVANAVASMMTSIVYDVTAPSPTYLGYSGGVLSSNFQGPVAMNCNDNFGCQSLSYFIGSGNPAATDWIACNANETAICVRDVTIGNGQSLYVRAVDNAGQIGYSTRQTLTVNGAPIITNLTLVSQNASWGVMPGFTPQPGVIMTATVSDNDISTCAVDEGDGTFRPMTSCIAGVNTFTFPLQGASNMLKTVTLKVTDSSNHSTSQSIQILYDGNRPLASYTGYTGGTKTAPMQNVTVTMNCNDDFGCQSIDYYKGPYFNSDFASCQGFDNYAGWQTCNPDETGSCTRTFDFNDNDSLCVRVKDNAGWPSYSTRDRLLVDNQPPQFGEVNLYKNDTPATPVILQPQADNVYYTDAKRLKVYFDVTDRNPSWRQNDFNSECNVTDNGLTVPAACSFPGNDLRSFLTIDQDLAQGAHTIVYTLADALGQASTVTFNVFIDNKAPTYNFGTSTTGLVAETNDAASEIKVTLPSAFEDLTGDNTPGSGIQDVRVTLSSSYSELTLSNFNIAPFTSYMHREGNTLVITPNTTVGAQTFPQTITFTALKTKDEAGGQYTYKVSVTAKDKAGNALQERAEAPLSVDGLNFDTLAPTFGTMTRPGMNSTRQGTGDPATPYLVGNTRTLDLRIPLTEHSNNYKHQMTTPISIFSLTAKNTAGVEVPGAVTLANTCAGMCAPNLLEELTHSITGGLDPDITQTVNCGTNGLDSNDTCQIFGTFTVQANFVGTVTILAADGAGNSSSKTFSVRQDSNPPLLGANFSLSANIAAGQHYIGEYYHFTATDVNKNGSDKQLSAFITYMGSDNSIHEINEVPMNLVPNTTDQYTFDINLTGVKNGAQDIQIYFEDNYGNRHDGSAAGMQTGSTIPYSIFHDADAPVVNGFRYTWTDDNVVVSYDSVIEASPDLHIQVQTAQTGQPWTNRSAEMTTSDLGPNTFTIPTVTEGEQIRVVFGDTVVDFQNGAVIPGQNPRYDYIFRDIVLTVTQGNEVLNVSYTPESNATLTDFNTYTVSYTGPNGRTGNFDPIRSFNAAGGTVGTIPTPLKGNYDFTIDLTYNPSTGKAPLHATKEYVQATDIIAPKATMTIPLVPTLVSLDPNGTYYVRSIDPELTLNYNINTEFGNIFDDSLPLHLNILGADDPVSVDINPTGTNPFAGVQTVNLFQEKAYDLQATISDGAGKSVPFSFHVIKDKSVPVLSSSFVDMSGNTLSLLSNDPNGGVILSKNRSVYMDVTVSNESEAVNFGNITGTTASLVGTPTMANGIQTQRYLLSDLADNAITTANVTVTDRAGSPQTLTAQIRHDDQAPLFDPTSVPVATDLAQASYNQNPVGVRAIYTDYSQISYIVTANETAQPARLYNGSIDLPQGQIDTLSIVFRDQLGNTTPASDSTINHPIFVDSIAPTADITFSPNAGPTNQSTVAVQVAHLIEVSPIVTWTARNGNTTVSSGVLMRGAEGYPESISLGDIPLLHDRSNDITVTLSDQLNNSLLSDVLHIVQDGTGPVVTFDTPTISSNGMVGWTFHAEDTSGVATVSARIRNLSNGTSSLPALLTPTNGVYSYLWPDHPVTPGQRYSIEVTATDTLTNASTTRSDSITAPTTNESDADPRLHPIDIPPNITGDTLTVTISNGTTINYIAENLPHGDHLYIQDVLDNGTNTVPGHTGHLDKLPAGTYTVTIVDNLGNTTSFQYVVAPYYLDPTGDIDGDGFGGGITDHKLLEMAIAAGNVYTLDNIQHVQAIQTLIEMNISQKIHEFLSDNFR